MDKDLTIKRLKDSIRLKEDALQDATNDRDMYLKEVLELRETASIQREVIADLKNMNAISELRIK